jgi:hypothetical protein
MPASVEVVLPVAESGHSLRSLVPNRCNAVHSDCKAHTHTTANTEHLETSRSVSIVARRTGDDSVTYDKHDPVGEEGFEWHTHGFLFPGAQSAPTYLEAS